MNHLEIHEQAVKDAKNFRRAEGKLIESLQRVKQSAVYRMLNYSSLHVYAVEALGLSDDQAYQFTRVAEKAIEIPELKTAIDSGVLNVSKARRILKVITPETKTEWIEKASQLPQRELEREVVRLHPKEAVRERIRPLSEELAELRCSIGRDLEEKIRRIKDLESQRTRKSVDLAEALMAACQSYLEKNDPVLKAKRNIGKTPPEKKSVLRQIPAHVRHQVINRDQGQCTFRNERGRRCPNKRWVDLHHQVPYSRGGKHSIENLTTLCSHHHKFHHTSLARPMVGEAPNLLRR